MNELFLLILLIFVTLVLGGVAAAAVVLFLRRAGGSAPEVISNHIVAERIRAVGKLVGLEVHAKEIATSTKGWSWIPPMLLSQARVAMIFAFEKQYFIDLTRLAATDVEETAPGEFTVRLPPIDGSLRLADVTPYDIQAGRILGLLDVIQMNAEAQKSLMKAAQDQASELFTRNDARYTEEARRAVGAQLESLLALFGARVHVRWASQPLGRVDTDMAVDAAMERKLAGAVG